MRNGAIGIVLALMCLGAFVVYGLPADGEPPLGSRTAFGLGAGFGVFVATGLRAMRNSRIRGRSRSDDAQARVERYGKTNY